MQGPLIMCVGVVLGIAGALPSAVLLERALRHERHPSMAAGLASIAFSFALLMAALFVVRLVAREHVLVFGVSEVASFLLVWVLEAWRAWRDAGRRAGSGGRKSGEPTRRNQRSNRGTR